MWRVWTFVAALWTEFIDWLTLCMTRIRPSPLGFARCAGHNCCRKVDMKMMSKARVGIHFSHAHLEQERNSCVKACKRKSPRSIMLILLHGGHLHKNMYVCGKR